MRQLSPLTNLLLACLSAVGLVASLTLPWYAPAVVVVQADLGTVANGDAEGPMQHFADWVTRVVSSGGATITGSSGLGSTRLLVLVLAILVAALALVALLPAARSIVRDLLRAVALATPVLVAVVGFSKIGGDQLEIRWGIVVALALATFMASCAWHGSAARKKKVPAARAATRMSA